MNFQPHAEHSKTADAAYVYLLASDSARVVALDDWRMVDYAADGSVAGIEFLGVSAGVDLRNVPERQMVESLLKGLKLRLFA